MNINMVAADLTRWVAWGGCTVTRITGFNNQAADLYIQLHENPVVANSDVPRVKALLCQSKNAFDYEFGAGISLRELMVAVSTTEVNYTAVGAAGGLDMTLEVTSDFLCNGTELIVGDLTAANNTFAIWADSAHSSNRLLRLDIIEQGAASGFILITTDDNNTQICFATPLLISSTVNLNFGYGGRFIFSKATDGTLTIGCTVSISSSAKSVVLAQPNWAVCRAIYRPGSSLS